MKLNNANTQQRIPIVKLQWTTKDNRYPINRFHDVRTTHRHGTAKQSGFVLIKTCMAEQSAAILPSELLRTVSGYPIRSVRDQADYNITLHNVKYMHL